MALPQTHKEFVHSLETATVSVQSTVQQAAKSLLVVSSSYQLVVKPLDTDSSTGRTQIVILQLVPDLLNVN